MVTEWTKAKETEVKTAREGILLNIERIDFYEAVGDTQGAIEAARDVFDQIMQEGENDLLTQIAMYMAMWGATD